MVAETATATEMQNNFGRYLSLVMNSGDEIVITRNGREVARLVPKDAAVSYLSDSLVGVLGKDIDFEKELEEGLKKKYEIAD